MLLAGALAVPVALGRTGIRANKFEGDGATPRGRFRLVRASLEAKLTPGGENKGLQEADFSARDTGGADAMGTKTSATASRNS